MMKKCVIASFILLSLTGSLLIILGGSIQFGKALWVASEDISLKDVLTWTLKLSITERFILFSIGFICIFFLLIDTVFVIIFLCTLKHGNFSVTKKLYKKFDFDVECPPIAFFGTPVTSTPKGLQTKKVLKISKPKVSYLSEVKKSSQINANEKCSKWLEKIDKIIHPKEMSMKEEEDTKSLLKYPVGKYWKSLDTIVDVHPIINNLKPTYFISIPNNAEQVGLSHDLQRILGAEIDEILSTTSLKENSCDVETEKSVTKYALIKPADEETSNDTLVEAIVYSGAKEILII